MIYDNVLQAVGHTPLVRLQRMPEPDRKKRLGETDAETSSLTPVAISHTPSTTAISTSASTGLTIIAIPAAHSRSDQKTPR